MKAKATKATGCELCEADVAWLTFLRALDGVRAQAEGLPRGALSDQALGMVCEYLDRATEELLAGRARG